MKKLLFTAIGIAAAVFAVKKLCGTKNYCSGDNRDECGYCAEPIGKETAAADETEEKDTESAENTVGNSEN